MKHKKSVLLAAALVAVSAVLIISVPGCTTGEQANPGPYQDPFFPQEYTRLHELATYHQATSAARADATLYDMHFHGGRLNSLGEDKVALMLDDDNDSRPLVIYIAANGADADFVAREESIRAFATAQGASSDELKFERGANPGSRTITAPQLQNFNRTESKPIDGPIGSAP
jgi:hypothetical protein